MQGVSRLEDGVHTHVSPGLCWHINVRFVDKHGRNDITAYWDLFIVLVMYCKRSKKSVQQF